MILWRRPVKVCGVHLVAIYWSEDEIDISDSNDIACDSVERSEPADLTD